MKTEEEAKQCWCPFARKAGRVAHNGAWVAAFASNIVEHDGEESRTPCIASACMMWDRFTQDGRGDCGLKHRDAPLGSTWTPKQWEEATAPRPYG